MKKNIPIQEDDYYITPEGYRCFTEQYHLRRGYCCESGCKHCPYGYDKTTNSIKKWASKRIYFTILGMILDTNNNKKKKVSVN